MMKKATSILFMPLLFCAYTPDKPDRDTLKEQLEYVNASSVFSCSLHGRPGSPPLPLLLQERATEPLETGKTEKSFPRLLRSPVGRRKGSTGCETRVSCHPTPGQSPRGPGYTEEGRESPRLSGKLVGTQSDGAGLGWAGSRAGPAPSPPSPCPLAVLCSVGCGGARSVVSGWALPRPPHTGVSGHTARELPMSRDPGRAPRGHRHREPYPTPPRPPLYSSKQ